MQMDLANLCLKAGVKNLSTVFLMTDAQVAHEKFLVLINDLLVSGKRLFALACLIHSPWSWSHLFQSQKSWVIDMREKTDTVENGFIKFGLGLVLDLLFWLFHLPFTAKQTIIGGAILVGLHLIIGR